MNDLERAWQALGSVRIDRTAVIAKIIANAGLEGYTVLKRKAQGLHKGNRATPIGDLLGTIEQVRECLRWLPNKRANGRDRDQWMMICHAVVAATGKGGEGKIAWLDWSADYDASDLGVRNADLAWEGIEPSACRVGIRWLATLAARESGGQCGVLFDMDFANLEATPDVDLKVNPLPAPPVSLEQRRPPSRRDVVNLVELLSDNCTTDDCKRVLSMMADARLDPADVETVLKALKGRSGLTLETLRRQLSTEMLRHDQARTYDVPRRLADAAHGQLGLGRLAWHLAAWWRYDGKCWRRLDELAIAATMQTIAIDQAAIMMSIGDSRPQNVSTAIDHAIKLLRQQVHTRLALLDKPEAGLRPIINVNNGTLHVSTRDGAVTFKPHDPNDCLTYVCDVDYDPKAACPRFDAVLADMVSETYYTVRPGDPEYSHLRRLHSPLERIALDDGRQIEGGPARTLKVFDRVENERLVLEVMGYPLTPWRGARCFVICKGNGRNGKTKLWETDQRFLSDDCVQNARISDLEKDRYAMSELVGKLLYIDDDVTRRAELPDGPLKTISENKQISAAVKFQPYIRFIAAVLPVVLCNSWPLTVDLSDGTRERAIVIPFNRVYPQELWSQSPWPAIWRDRTEMSGIFNRLLAALARVFQRGYIERTRASLEAFHDWIRASAPEIEFLDACCVRERPASETGDGETINVLYGVFNSWYSINFGTPRGIHGGKRFRDVLEQLGFEVYRTGKFGWRVRNLWLKPEIADKSGIGVIYMQPPDDEDEEKEP